MYNRGGINILYKNIYIHMYKLKYKYMYYDKYYFAELANF